MKLENVSLKSALNLLLHQVHLEYVIKDEVLNVTTKKQAAGRQETKTYQVADLVIPVENFALPNSANVMKILDSKLTRPNGVGTAATPYTGPLSLPGGSQASTPGTGVVGTNAGAGTNGGIPVADMTASNRRPGQTMEDLLIKLITNTIAPQSWSDMGGQGSIDYFPLGMALVINQTVDIQEQIAQLLDALRRLQELEVAVEVRFITLAENFYERIGLDFNINVKTDRETARFEPQLTQQAFKPLNFVNDFSPDHFITGLTPAGTFTSDLDIPIRTSSFGMGIPPFGGFPNIPGGNGGIELGLAFLSDIQVFLFMEAAQGDQRTNVMQAPKLTLFNGQTASILIQDQQFFVTDVVPAFAGGQLTFIPTNTPIPTGVALPIQAVVSADRRFVRLSMQQLTITNLASAVVPLFPLVFAVTPQFEGGFAGNPVLFTQFIQQPVINTIQVNTTVTVPDGGTVVLGGLKRLSEGRNEFGPPILSKIPYVNRLFKNVGFGREVTSLLIMVTPRIIINEEEEFRQTGVGIPPGGP
jgi:type II secretory pathway component GspD/PulD (secretin)